MVHAAIAALLHALETRNDRMPKPALLSTVPRVHPLQSLARKRNIADAEAVVFQAQSQFGDSVVKSNHA
jgi:hypothetical protein